MQGKVQGVLNSVFVLHMWIYRHCKYLDIKIYYMLSRPLKKSPYYRGLKRYPRQYSQEQRECIKSRDSAHLPGIWDATSKTVASLFPPPAMYCRKDIQQRSLLLQHLQEEAEEPDLQHNSGKFNGSLQNLQMIMWWEYKWREMWVETREDSYLIEEKAFSFWEQPSKGEGCKSFPKQKLHCFKW